MRDCLTRDERDRIVIADPFAQLRLLDLQALDTALAQLAHRRRTLPELAAIGAATARIRGLEDEATTARVEIDDIQREQRRLEADVDMVRARSQKDSDRMLGGGLPSRELESLQHEISTLARRQSTLEDEVLEVMERLETAEGTLNVVAGQIAEANSERLNAAQKRDDAFADIDDQSRIKASARATLAAAIPADLLALYEKIRDSSGGSGAAALHQRRCEGCRLELAGNELSSVRAATPQTVVRCENCRRILIRTAESGL
jgi:predicted  nucleic acid-binding Zn-ribbon protein